MENNTMVRTKTVVRDKCRLFSVLGGVCFLLHWIIQYVDNLMFGGIPSDEIGIWFAELGFTLLFTIALFVGGKNAFLRISSVVFAIGMTFLSVYRQIIQNSNFDMSISSIYRRVLSSSSGSIIEVLIWNVAIYGSLLFIILCNCCSEAKFNGVLKKVYFIPAAISLVSAALPFFNGFLFRHFSITVLLFIISSLVKILALFFTAKWVVNEFEYIKVPVNEKTSAEGYIDLAMHVLLMLLTCGVWMYIWIYRTTDYLNKCKNAEPRTPVNQLLLCMFVPFYIIYWTYQSAQRIYLMAKKKGMNESISTMCLVLEIFIPIVPPILMQSKINSTISAPAVVAQTVPTFNTQSAPISNADELKKFKDLYDSGVITEEEFAEKKKQLLGL